MNLSAIILTRNEERNIEDCLKSVKFCDEIIVIDDESTDQTVKLAEKLGARVYRQALNNDFASQRNFGLTKAQGRWCLFVDADERVSPALESEIKKAVSALPSSVTGYLIPRKDRFLGRVLNFGECGNIRLLRLARKGAGRWQRRVHEQWSIFGDTKKIKAHLDHFSHPTLFTFIADLNKYSTLHAQANSLEQKKSSLIKIKFYPWGKFIQNYIFKLGFLDGSHGFIFAMLMSFHSFLAWSKLWLMQTKKFRH